MAKFTKRAASAVAKAVAPIVAAAIVARLTTGKIDLKGVLLEAAKGVIRATRRGAAR